MLTLSKWLRNISGRCFYQIDIHYHFTSARYSPWASLYFAFILCCFVVLYYDMTFHDILYSINVTTSFSFSPSLHLSELFCFRLFWPIIISLYNFRLYPNMRTLKNPCKFCILSFGQYFSHALINHASASAVVAFTANFMSSAVIEERSHIPRKMPSTFPYRLSGVSNS